MPLPLIGFFTGGLFAKVSAFIIASSIVRLAVAVGFAVVTYQGIDLLVTGITDEVFSYMSGLPADMYQVFELFGFVFAIEMLIATSTAILAIKSLASVKKAVLKC